MSNGGKYVLAPTVSDDSDGCEIEGLNDGHSICSDEMEVAAHEVVEMEDHEPIEETSAVDGKSHHSDEITNNLTGKRPSEAMTTRETGETGRFDADPPLTTGFTDRGSNIRWEIIPKFPKDIPSNKLWENWQGFIENFELATSFSTFARQADRAKLLYMSIGKNLQDIVSAANLKPNYQDPTCYSTLVDGINKYFKSMTDTASEHDAFQAMRQAKGESIVAFHARLTQKARLCGYSTNEDRFVLAQLLKGMQNRELSLAARTYGHDASYIVQAATRVEAYRANEEVTEPLPTEPHFADVQAVNHKRAASRERHPGQFRKTRKFGNFRGSETRAEPRPEIKTPKESGHGFRQGRRNRCWRCGSLYHFSDECPALGQRCNFCGREGHFASKCTDRPRRKRINNVQEEEPRRSLPRGWKKESTPDQV